MTKRGDLPVARRKGGALPKVLLALVLAATAATCIWADVASSGYRPGSTVGPGPPVAVALVGRGDAARRAPGDAAKAEEIAAAAPPKVKASPVSAPVPVFQTPGTPTYTLARLPDAKALATAPDRALSGATGTGKLLAVGPDGRRPWRVYARAGPTG